MKGKLPDRQIKLCVIGLGYVGLPLAVELGKHFHTTGFDINKERIRELSNNKDVTLEVTKQDLREAKSLTLTSSAKQIKDANIYIVTVPTPITLSLKPDLGPLRNACRTVANVLQRGDIVVFESTVFPGATREICIPILEKSGLKFNKDFSCGYSPERINPGDSKMKLRDIIKVVSASNNKALKKIKLIYEKIIDAGIYVAESIEVAEAAKVIENTQRDLNIALMNELSMIFNKMGLDTNEVLSAANTKWNFLDFKPGLVGGHCIGVDPYYLTFKSKQLNLIPKVILAGRRTNNSMSKFVVEELKNIFLKSNLSLKGKKILILGLAFKEDCTDIRNSKVFDIIDYLNKEKALVEIYDPLINTDLEERTFERVYKLDKQNYHAVILAVPHKKIIKMGIKKIKTLLLPNGIFFDLKAKFKKHESNFRL